MSPTHDAPVAPPMSGSLSDITLHIQFAAILANPVSYYECLRLLDEPNVYDQMVTEFGEPGDMPDHPLRLVTNQHRCLCVLIADESKPDPCPAYVSPDEPFCDHCEDRHPGFPPGIVVTTLAMIQ